MSRHSREIGKHLSPSEKDSKRNLKKREKHSAKLEETVRSSLEISKLPKLNQDDIHLLTTYKLELCPYMRNITIDREKLLVYGRCALPEDYVPGQDITTCKSGGSSCPRNRVDPIGEQGCWHYNLLWGKRDYVPKTTNSS